ncbi:MAG: ribosome maturation factor RimM [Nannocystaceae bacterium]|nr:ribosome maturation factor RimM [bacterium]
MSNDTDAATRLSVGYIAGAHGVQGMVRVQLFDRGSEALAPDVELILVDRESKAIVHTKRVQGMAMVPGKPAARVQFEGVTDREGAEALRGLTVEVLRDALPELEEDEFYLADAVGLVVERLLEDGAVQRLGKVVAVTTNGAQDLFEIEYFDRGRARRWLIPVLPGFVKDVDDQRVVVDPPEGMLPEALEQP